MVSWKRRIYSWDAVVLMITLLLLSLWLCNGQGRRLEEEKRGEGGNKKIDNEDVNGIRGISTQRTEEIIRGMGKGHMHALRLISVQPKVDMKGQRILCWVNTYEGAHATRIPAIKETWGKSCDRILFMSNVEDLSIPTVRVVAPPTHEALWQKHREVVKAIYHEFEEGSYDWFFKCDDDTFLIMDNLKHYLQSPEIQAKHERKQPLLLGHRMTLQWWEMQRPFEPLEESKYAQVNAMHRIKKENPKGLLYTPGGGGYALNYAYLKLLVESLDQPFCLPGKVVPDDWAISFCMYFHGVKPLDTRDDAKRERFHQYSPKRVFFADHDPEAYDHKYFTSIYQENNWFSDHNGIGWQNREQCCAPDTIAFHYITPTQMRWMYEYYYQLGYKNDPNHVMHQQQYIKADT